MFVYLCVCASVCVPVYVSVYVSMSLSISVYLCVCNCVSVHLCVYLCVPVYVSVYVSMSLCMSVYLCVCVCTFACEYKLTALCSCGGQGTLAGVNSLLLPCGSGEAKPGHWAWLPELLSAESSHKSAISGGYYFKTCYIHHSVL